MIYDYRKLITDKEFRRKVDFAMKSKIGSKMTSYLYQKIEENFPNSTNELDYIMDHVHKGDVFYVYDASFLGKNDDEALMNLEILSKKGVEVIDCNGKSQTVAKTFDFKSTKGYAWIKNKVLTEKKDNEYILIGFNTLNEFSPEQYSIDGSHPLTMDSLNKIVEEIKQDNDEVSRKIKEESRKAQLKADEERKKRENKDKAFSIIEREIAKAIDDLDIHSELDFYIDYNDGDVIIKENT